MKKLTSIKSRLLLGYISILLVTIVAGFYLVKSNRDVKTEVNTFVDQTIPTLNIIATLQADSKELVLASFQLYGYTLEADAFTKLNSELIDRITKYLTRLQGQLPATENQQLTKTLRLLSSATLSLKKTMTAKSVDWDAARTQLADLSKHSGSFNQQLVSIAGSISEQARLGNKRIDQVLTQNSYTVHLLLLLITVVAVIFYLIANKQVAQPIENLASDLKRIADERDLTAELDGHSVREIDSAAQNVNYLLSVFKGGIEEIQFAVDGLHQSIQHLGSSSTHSSKAIAQLGDKINILVGTMEQLSSQMISGLDYSNQAVEGAHQGAESINKSKQLVQTAMANINQLASDMNKTSSLLASLEDTGDKVSGVVNSIAEIASQTNLLALNAAIEAARAGESGRGFAVVADEVRTLASRTQQATEEINSMLADIVQYTRSSVSNMNSNQDTAQQSVTLTHELVTNLDQDREIILTLVELSQQAADVTQNSHTQMNELNAVVDEFKNLGNSVNNANAAVTSESHKLTGLAKQLDKTTEFFKHS